MSQTGKFISLFVNFIVVVAALFWFANNTGYDSGIASLAALASFTGLLFVKTDKKDSNANMTQNAGANSTLYQSNGPMEINNK